MATEQEQDLEQEQEQEQDDGVAEAAAALDDFEVEIVDEETEGEPASASGEPASDEGEPTSDSADDVEEPDDEEYQHSSRSVKKRIMREIKLRKRVTAQMQGQLQQAATVVQTLAQREASANDKLVDLQASYVALLDTSLTNSIDFKQRELRKAKDEGDTEAEIKVLSELQTLAYQKQQTDDLKSQVATRKAQGPAAAQPIQQPAQQQNPLALKWFSKNRAIFEDQKTSAEALMIRVLDNQLGQEGWDQHTEEYFRELDRRIDAKLPGLRKKPPARGAPTPRSPVAAVRSGAGSASAPKKGMVQLTREDLATMRTFGLDPANKAHLKEFARSKLNAA